MDSDDCEVWNDVSSNEMVNAMPLEDLTEPDMNIGSTTSVKFNQTHFLVHWLLAFFFKMQSAFHISDCAIECIFRFLATFFVVMSKVFPSISPLATGFQQACIKQSSL